MIIDDLIHAGYKEFPICSGKFADRAFQKRIGSTRYFINVYYYNMRSWAPKMANPDSYSCDIQFRTPDGDYINVEFPCTKLSVEELEAKVEKIFIALECSDYED